MVAKSLLIMFLAHFLYGLRRSSKLWVKNEMKTRGVQVSSVKLSLLIMPNRFNMSIQPIHSNTVTLANPMSGLPPLQCKELKTIKSSQYDSTSQPFPSKIQTDVSDGMCCTCVLSPVVMRWLCVLYVCLCALVLCSMENRVLNALI